METRKNGNRYNTRNLKLSLKKNKLKTDEEPKKFNRSSDIIILDESFDSYKLDAPKKVSEPMIYSPIVVNDSCSFSDEDLPKVSFTARTPSKSGNVSFNCSNDTPSPAKESQPSIGGWSPAQHIITANPKNNKIPSTPKDKANESYKECSIKTVERSQKKILNELYGKSWKSIPKLFKTISKKYENFDGITKKLFDDDDEKENVRHDIRKNKEIYLTNSDVKRNEANNYGTEKKSKKKLYTEKVPCTPDVPKKVARNVSSTTKKVKIKKGMSVTELVAVMKNDDEKVGAADTLLDNIENILTSTNIAGSSRAKEIDASTKKQNCENDKHSNNVDILPNKKKSDDTKKSSKNMDLITKRIENIAVTPKNDVKRLSFMGSLADNVPSWRCHPEAFQYIDNFKALKEQLSRRLYKEFNAGIFGDAMDADMLIVWDTKLRSTAGTTTNSLIKTARGDRIRSSRIKLSSKVLDTPQRVRDTLVHEMCHAATWLLDGEMRAGHGPLWRNWAKRALRAFPELGEISRCHDMEIHYKYSYQCVKCGYTIRRHSKSIDITKKACGYCLGTFQIVVNKKNKDGVVVTTPARKATNGFALYVKENYASLKDRTKTHAQVMKLLGEQYAASKNNT